MIVKENRPDRFGATPNTAPGKSRNNIIVEERNYVKLNNGRMDIPEQQSLPGISS